MENPTFNPNDIVQSTKKPEVPSISNPFEEIKGNKKTNLFFNPSNLSDVQSSGNNKRMLLVAGLIVGTFLIGLIATIFIIASRNGIDIPWI